MTQYSGIAFYILLEIILLSTSIYFYKDSPLLSILFFIAAIATLVFIYKEFTFYKTNKLNISEETTPEVIHIKYSLSSRVINILVYFLFIVVSIFFLNACQNKNNIPIFVPIMAIGVILFCIVMITKEIKKNSTILISISNDGIQVNNGHRMNWSEIEYEKVISKYIKSKNSRHDHRVEINYLFFFYKSERIEIKIDEINITDYNLVRYLKIYRERFNNTNRTSHIVIKP